MPALTGFHHLKIPVTDVARSLDFYERVFGIKVTLSFSDDDGVLRGLVGELPNLGGTLLALRDNPELAKALSGFDPISFAVQTKADVEEWAAYLDQLGIPHKPIAEAAIGYILIFNDPDGLELHIYSWETPPKKEDA